MWNHGKKRASHGLSKTAEYRIWQGMWQRCTNPKATQYARYGGRGIRVCSRWKAFELFLADLGRRPTPKHTLDRIKNNKGYSPKNCRWATRHQQQQNTCWSKSVGSLSFSEAAYTAGLTKSGLQDRLNRGLSEKDALTRPKFWVLGKQYIGVSLEKTGRYYAYAKKNNKMVNLGRYATAEEAAKARDKWVKTNRPYLLNLNFPEE